MVVGKKITKQNKTKQKPKEKLRNQPKPMCMVTASETELFGKVDCFKRGKKQVLQQSC